VEIVNTAHNSNKNIFISGQEVKAVQKCTTVSVLYIYIYIYIYIILEEVRKGKNIVKWIKGQRISCLGHLERMEEDRMHIKIFTQELEGTRRRPRKGWREVERDLQVLGVRRWRELVTNRGKRRNIVRQAKAHSGP
jgi:hypothetical protein